MLLVRTELRHLKIVSVFFVTRVHTGTGEIRWRHYITKLAANTETPATDGCAHIKPAHTSSNWTLLQFLG
jgi:hypothetical protein